MSMLLFCETGSIAYPMLDLLIKELTENHRARLKNCASYPDAQHVALRSPEDWCSVLRWW